MSKHTPGPWLNLSHGIFSRAGQEICDSPASDSAKGYWEANARLIAAAPVLLEALEATRAQWIHSVNAEQCLEAIAKATGK